MAEPTFFDEQVFKGSWWLPADPDDRVGGVLTYTPEESTLELFGDFKDSPTHPIEMTDRPLILGESENKVLTLVECGGRGKNTFFGSGKVTSRYAPRLILIGRQFSDTADLVFPAVAFTFTDLELWLDEHPLKLDPGQGDEGITMGYKRPDAFSIEIPTLGAVIDSHNRMSYRKNQTSQSMEYYAFLRITPEVPRTLKWHIETVHEILGFVSFLADLPIYIRRMTCHLTKDEPDPRKRHSCNLLFSSRSQPKETKQSRPRDILITRPRVGPSLDLMLKNWFAKHDQLHDATSLLLSHRYLDMVYIETEFLNLMQALEGLSRAIDQGSYVSRDEYAAILKKLKKPMREHVPDKQLRCNMHDSLAFACEYPLRERLARLLSKCEKETVELLCKDRDGFIRRIVKTRNYFSHYAKNLKNVALEGEQLFWANYRLRILLLILVLKELGITDEESLRKLFKCHPTYSQGIQRCLATENWTVKDDKQETSESDGSSN